MPIAVQCSRRLIYSGYLEPALYNNQNRTYMRCGLCPCENAACSRRYNVITAVPHSSDLGARSLHELCVEFQLDGLSSLDFLRHPTFLPREFCHSSQSFSPSPPPSNPLFCRTIETVVVETLRLEPLILFHLPLLVAGLLERLVTLRNVGFRGTLNLVLLVLRGYLPDSPGPTDASSPAHRRNTRIYRTVGRDEVKRPTGVKTRVEPTSTSSQPLRNTPFSSSSEFSGV